MRVIALTNRKGGVGKTTLSEQMAFAFATANARVLLMDTDGQANSSFALTQKLEYSDEETIMPVLLQEDSRLAAEQLMDLRVQSHWHSNLFVLPANESIFKLGQMLGLQEGIEQRIANVLKHLDSEFDVCIVDTQPAFGLPTEMAFAAANDLIIPVEAHHDEVLGLYQLINSISRFRNDHNPSLKIQSIVINKFDARRAGHKSVLAQLRNHQHIGKIVDGVISNNVAIPYAQHEHMSVFEYDPRSEASKQLGQYIQVLFGKLRGKR
jgi:chromosome partitioning protein